MDAREDAQDNSIRTTLSNLIADCEVLLGQFGDEGSRRYRHTVRALDRQLQQTREDLDDLHYSAMRRARAGIRRADEYVHENPWQSIAIGAGVAALIGIAIGVMLADRR